MVPHVFFYPLVLIALVWLFVIAHAAWPSQRTATDQRPATPIKSSRRRANEPKPFVGLTHRPHCAACEHDATHPKAPPPVPPNPMPSTNRRPRAIETSMGFQERAAENLR
jgi:hypothetical protein